MLAFIAGLVARFPRAGALALRLFHWQAARRAKNWATITAQTPHAPRFAHYPAEFNSLWFVRTTPNNCYTYANATRTSTWSDCKQPGVLGAWPQGTPWTRTRLMAALALDGWQPGIPDELASESHVAVAFVGYPRDEDGRCIDSVDFHFYRLGPDGWSHKPGDEESEWVDNPFEHAVSHGYIQFAGFWLVPHDEALNRVRNQHRAQDHPLLEVFDLRGPVD